MAGLGLGVTVSGTGFCRPVLERCVVDAASNQRAHPGCSFVPRSQLPSSSVRVRASARITQQQQSWRGKKRLIVVRMSVDVDDSAAAEGSTSTEELAATDQLVKEATEDLQKELDSRRGLEEKFLVVNSGKHECRSCGYLYESEKGDSLYPIPGGTAFSDLPKDWRCPTCGAARSFFQSKGMEVAGFVQNQGYGLGGNSLTEGQKSLLIYGSLVFFFCIFLSGYFLQ